MSNNANVAAKRQGSATGRSNNSVDMSALAIGMHKSRINEREAIERYIGNALSKTRELRLAGMINKQGADEISNNLIMAFAILENAI